jgi:molecular chaperone GrpE
VSENKNGGGDGSDLKKAMADAMRAVEEREAEAHSGRDADEETSDEASPDQASSDRPKGAGEAITESLLKAKNELQEALKQTQTEAQSMRDKWLRAAADLDNYRKRAQKEREDVQKFGNERLLRDFLPVLDDLDRVVASAAAKTDRESAAVIDGVRLVLKKFTDQLERHGVTSFDAAGKPFDPNLHEAVQQVVSDLPMGSVVDQLQRGFTISGRLLRPALVTVSLGPAKPGNES